jgi:predicted permease
MNRVRAWFCRLVEIFGRDRRDHELDAEIESHIAMHVEANVRAGMTPDEARRAALIKLGGVEQTKENYRDRRGLPWLEMLAQDVRFGVRMLRKNPILAATAIVSLALAIGANTALYSIIDAALLRPLPLPQPDRLFTMSTPESDQPGLPTSDVGNNFSYPLYEELSAAAGDSAQIALFDSPGPAETQIPDAGAPVEKVIEQYLSPNALDVLGVAPAIGRLFSPAQDRFPGPRPAVILSHDYWQRRFGADPGILSKTLTLHGKTFWILGVARRGFFGADPGKSVDIWLPITTSDPGVFTNAEFRAFHLMGRLALDVTRDQLAARLQPAFHQHQERRIAANASAMPISRQTQLRKMALAIRPGANGISSFGELFSRPLWILLGISACLLLISCANVAGLLLARSAARSGELALRVSLGANRWRLMRQLLTESSLIAIAACPCAWIVARLAAPSLVAMVSQSSDPITLDLALDTRVLFFCALVCVTSLLFFGTVPAWSASRAQPMLALRHAIGQTDRLRLGRLFVGLQVAFAFFLVTTGAGFLFSLLHLSQVARGFDARGVTVLTVTNTQQRDRQWSAMQALLSRTSDLPGVQGAATGWMALFSGDRRAQRIVLPGKPPSNEVETFYRVSPNYFGTLRTPLLAGRDFTFLDNDNEPVPTIVNRTFAQKYFGTESVIGQEFRRDDGALHWIVGLAADSHFDDLRNGPEAIAYMPMKPPRIYTLYVRSTIDPASISKMVSGEVETLSSGAYVSDVTTLNALVGSTILKEKLLGAIGGAFAFLGLTLAAIGLFGLLNYSVTLRTKEIGIRTALGAPRRQIYGLIGRDVLTMIAGGLVMGMVASLATMRIAQSLLFGVKAVDATVIGTATAVFLCAAAIAGALPAHRAASIDPVSAMRCE